MLFCYKGWYSSLWFLRIWKTFSTLFIPRVISKREKTTGEMFGSSVLRRLEKWRWEERFCGMNSVLPSSYKEYRQNQGVRLELSYLLFSQQRRDDEHSNVHSPSSSEIHLCAAGSCSVSWNSGQSATTKRKNKTKSCNEKMSRALIGWLAEKCEVGIDCWRRTKRKWAINILNMEESG